jgi:hypothetical protein
LILILVTCGLIELGMIGILLYGARSLPADARIPILSRGVRVDWPKWPGLLSYPVLGAIIYGVFIDADSTATKQQQRGSAAMILGFALIALFQFLAIRWTLKPPGPEWGVPNVHDEADGSSNWTPDVPDV